MGLSVSHMGSSGRLILRNSLSLLLIMKVTTSSSPRPTRKFLSPLLKTSNWSSPASQLMGGIIGSKLS